MKEQTKKENIIEVEKFELEKDQRCLKTTSQRKAVPQAESEDEEVERMWTGSRMNGRVETANGVLNSAQ